MSARTDHIDAIVRRLASRERSRALDLGCGDLQVSSQLARLGFECTAVDLFPPRRVPPPRVSFVQADARGLAIEAETYDLIVAKNVLHFFRGSVARDLVDRCTRALRPDGMLLLETFTIHDPSFEAVRSRQWSEVEPRSFVDPSSSQERSFVADGELLEWARNRGLCVVAHYESIIHDSHPPEGPHEHGVAVLAALRSPEG